MACKLLTSSLKDEQMKRYCKTSNIRHILVGNTFIDHSLVVGAAPRRCSNYIFILDITPGFNGLGKENYCKTSNIHHTFSKQWIYWSLRCSWSIACRCCSNYIFILNLTPGFNWLGKDNYKTRWEIFKFWDLVCLILDVSTVNEWTNTKGVES